VELVVNNRRRWLTSWAVSLVDRLERQEPLVEDDDAAQAEVALAEIRPGQSATAGYRCHITRRGRYQFGPLQVSCKYPFGLVRASCPLDCTDTLLVTPRLGRLTRRWEPWLAAVANHAQQSSPRRNPLEGDFYGLRPWRSGDSRRWIHWRTSARLNELSVRQFDQGRSVEVALLIDLWSPVATAAARGDLELAISLSATLVAQLCHSAGNSLTVALHSHTPRQWTGPAAATLAAEIHEALATARTPKRDELRASLDRLLSTAPPSARLIVISTRRVDLESLLAESVGEARGGVHAAVARAAWLDVTDPETSDVFALD
jgi:uncharacterized protein (DUF58 family)